MTTYMTSQDSRMTTTRNRHTTYPKLTQNSLNLHHNPETLYHIAAPVV
jgi:hypothetical protein